MTVGIQIGIGEAIDRISILEIKMERIEDEAKLVNIKREYDFLINVMLPIQELVGTKELYEQLIEVNEKLWDIEDALRKYEKNENFGYDFIMLARSVYQFNDKRAEIKRAINELYKSDIIEEKSYN